MISFEKTRDKIFNEMRLEMHGPSARDNYKIRSHNIVQTPQSTFSCGMLFPREIGMDEEDNSSRSIDDEDLIDAEIKEEEPKVLRENKSSRDRNVSQEQDNTFDDLNLSNQLKPSSISLSCRLKKAKVLFIKIYYAQYVKISIKDTIIDKVKADFIEYEDFIKWFRNSELTEKTMRNYLSALVFLSEDFLKQNLTKE